MQVLAVAYFGGLVLLRKQFAQEKAAQMTKNPQQPLMSATYSPVATDNVD